MAKRTQIVCLHEGKNGNVDQVFINRLLKKLDPSWLRPFKTGVARFVCGGGRNEHGMYRKFIEELAHCDRQGGDTTLIVLSDVDDLETPDKLKSIFDQRAAIENLGSALSKVVYIFPQNRIENWFEYLLDGATDESKEGKRRNTKDASNAADKLAKMCIENQRNSNIPLSLQWSCNQWRDLVNNMKG